MNKSQQLQLHIAKEIKRICEMHKIKYFLIAGSTLGAIRHHGFIPWDDDMDFGMERNDYNLFVEACKTDLGSDFYLQTWDSEENYAFPFGKLMLKDTVWVEDYAKNADINHFLYVDIFPYDAIPNEKAKRFKQKIYNAIYRQLLLAGNKYDSYLYKKGFKRVLFLIMRFLHGIIPKKYIKKQYKKLIEQGHEIDSKEYYAFGYPYSYDKSLMKKEWINNLITIEFEGETFFITKEWDEYLRNHYGEYMTPPPEDKRGNYHSIIKSDLSKYENIQL